MFCLDETAVPAKVAFQTLLVGVVEVGRIIGAIGESTTSKNGNR